MGWMEGPEAGHTDQSTTSFRAGSDYKPSLKGGRLQGASSYFDDTIATQRELRRHGFEALPTEEEAPRYLFDVSDRLDAVCEALGLEAGKDVRGKWRVYAAGKPEVV